MTRGVDALALYRRHLAAAADPARVEELAAVWEADGVVEFPYAPGGGVRRLAGLAAMRDYFGGLPLFDGFAFCDLRVWEARDVGSGEQSWLAEVHGSARLPDGASYEQDYVVRFATSERGRLVWMWEYWDPTRLSPA